MTRDQSRTSRRSRLTLRFALAAILLSGLTALTACSESQEAGENTEFGITPDLSTAREEGFGLLAGHAPFTVAFGVRESADEPEREAATYSWDFDGDGRTDSRAASPNHTYESPGEYGATLDVVYEDGSRKRDEQRIVAIGEPEDPDWRFGVTAHLNRSHNVYESDAEVERAAASLSRLGVDAARLDMSWAAIQPEGPGEYDWSDYDYLFGVSESYGFDLFPVVGYSSLWSSGAGFLTPDSQSVFYPPDANEYAYFAYEAARRYGDDVEAWQVWNEPNNEYFALPEPDAAVYTELLGEGYLAIKYADPDSTVVLGGLSNDTPHSLPPAEYLSDIYALGGGDYFDAVARHPYTTYAEGTPELRRRIDDMRRVMSENDDADKPLWITEFGATTLPGDEAEYREQAELLATSLDVMGEYENIPTAFWYNLRDTEADPEIREYHYGLLNHDFTRKPGYESYRSYIGEGEIPIPDARP